MIFNYLFAWINQVLSSTFLPTRLPFASLWDTLSYLFFGEYFFQ